MARKKKNVSGKRGPISTASEAASRPLVSPRPVSIYNTILSELEDRRLYHPLGKQRPLKTLRSEAARIKIAEPVRSLRKPVTGKKLHDLPSGTSFRAAERVPLCVRRHRRREVLFASQKTGAGARSKKHRNQWSSIKC